MRKKTAALTLAMALCAGFVTQNVHAASCPPHNWQIVRIKGQYTSGADHHKVYRDQNVNGQQVYDYCTVTETTTIYDVFCSECKTNGTDTRFTYSHSLANDPDHN